MTNKPEWRERLECALANGELPDGTEWDIHDALAEIDRLQNLRKTDQENYEGMRSLMQRVREQRNSGAEGWGFADACLEGWKEKAKIYEAERDKAEDQGVELKKTLVRMRQERDSLQEKLEDSHQHAIERDTLT